MVSGIKTGVKVIKCVNKPQQILPIIIDMLLNSNIKGKTLPQQKKKGRDPMGIVSREVPMVAPKKPYMH
jgi:hypothetical protein